jgi:hypothetical protein
LYEKGCKQRKKKTGKDKLKGEMRAIAEKDIGQMTDAGKEAGDIYLC